MLDLVRLHTALPLPNQMSGDRLEFPWHRALDRAMAAGAGRSWRGGDWRTFYVHPPNARKAETSEWFAVLDRLKHGFAPRAQTGKVEWTGGMEDWIGPPRDEPFVFVVCRRNVEPGRLRRCLASIVRQKGPRWGAVVFDDASKGPIRTWHAPGISHQSRRDAFSYDSRSSISALLLLCPRISSRPLAWSRSSILLRRAGSL